ncbi:MAG: GNAT family N-acetyltransferase [Nitrospinae bacterium]|nr:GNAT family N-acetyltransferase [Nitrospinota bacterium]
MQSVVIIEANLEDPKHQEAIIEMVNAYARDPMGNGRDLPDHVRNALIPGLRHHPTSMIFLAFQGEEPVGIAVCFLGFSTFAARPLINVHDLAVIPEYRRQGVGRRLLERVEAKGRELGCCKLTLEVREDNHSAQRLYREVGFGDGEFDRGAAPMRFLGKRL